MRAQAGLGFALLGWFRRFCLPPPPLVFWSSSVGLRFSFPLPFQGLPAPGQVCWCVFSPSLPFLRSPLGSLLSNCSSHLHFHFTFIVFHLHLHLMAGTSVFPPHFGGVCVCVKHLNRCKTSIRFVCSVLHVSRGTQHFTGTVSNEATSGMGYPAWPAGRTCFRHSNRLSLEPARRNFHLDLVVVLRDSVPNRSL